MAKTKDLSNEQIMEAIEAKDLPTQVSIFKALKDLLDEKKKALDGLNDVK